MMGAANDSRVSADRDSRAELIVAHPMRRCHHPHLTPIVWASEIALEYPDPFV